MVKAETERSGIVFRPIGVIHSPFVERRGMPIQAAMAQDVPGTVEIDPAYLDGLLDLGGFSHIFLIYHFHLSDGYALLVRPYLDDALHGVFATRAPRRPNAVGLSIVRLDCIEGSVLHVRDIDVVDGTPLLDIKPYVPRFDDRKSVRIGWLERGLEWGEGKRADGRFE